LKSISLVIGFLFLFWSCNNQTNETPKTEEKQLGQDCVVFLELFAAEIEDYVTVVTQIEQGESDFNIILKRNDLEQSIQSYLSDPTFFKCSSSPAFNTKMDSLNALMEI
tara:strand:+ start:275 stop:601 length:327 start_codon:yes stop_codon:yes gene_type:complete